jgi:hypothetical protein
MLERLGKDAPFQSIQPRRLFFRADDRNSEDDLKTIDESRVRGSRFGARVASIRAEASEAVRGDRGAEFDRNSRAASPTRRSGPQAIRAVAENGGPARASLAHDADRQFAEAVRPRTDCAEDRNCAFAVPRRSRGVRAARHDLWPLGGNPELDLTDMRIVR